MARSTSALRVWALAISTAWTLAAFAGPPNETARRMTDGAGRTVRVPDDPLRVVALAPSITEIVFALGEERRLAGVTRFSDYPEAATRLPKVGSYVHLDLERIAALNPDLCIAVKDGNPIEVIRRLEGLGIPVFAVDPRDLKTVMAAIGRIGVLFGAEDRAAVLVRDMAGRIDRVRRRAAQAERRPGVFFQIGIQPIVAVGTETFIHELIETAGGRNLTEGDVPYPRMSREQVLALAPDVIIVTSMARGDAFKKMKAEWERWADLPAARWGRIHLVDSNLFDRPTPRMVSGLELLFRLIHPEMNDSGAQ
jgi:iron complex transport system substrate-binding protein